MSELDKQVNGCAGKSVRSRLYLHIDYLGAGALRIDDGKYAKWLSEAEECTGLRRGQDFNLVRFVCDGDEVALLRYPGFFDAPSPALAASWRVDLPNGTVSHRTYTDSPNPSFFTARS